MTRAQKAIEAIAAIERCTLDLSQAQAAAQRNIMQWDAAMTLGDGMKEHEYRQKAHALLDQVLDLKQQVLQLVKTFEKL